MTQSVAEGTGTPSELRVGDRVRVRSREEILATLDADGRLDGLPFMPEALAFAGTELPVYKSAHKTCDTINKGGAMREMPPSVHLTGARCDGSAHGGCQAGCMLFWREEWLERLDGTPLNDHVASRPEGVEVTEETLHADTVAGTDENGEPIYRCSATELVRASKPLSPWQFSQYAQDIRTGNASRWQITKAFLIILLNKYQRLSQKLPKFLRIAEGRFYPFYKGTGPSQATPPLNLQPGDLVEVKSKEEIMATLGPNNRNRGLWFDGEMLPYVGRRGRVHGRLDHIVDEVSGRMLKLRDCVVIEEINCMGCYHRFCPRSDYIYWREAWLRRVPEPAGGQETV